VSGGARAGWLAGYVLATFLSFPHPVGGFVLDLGLGLSWLAPACLLLGLRGLGVRAAARAAFVAGLAAHAAVFHWIHVVTVSYGHAPALVGPLAVVLLALYPAAFVAAFGAGAAALASARRTVGTGRDGDPMTGGLRGLPSPWAAAALWAALDHGRSFLLTGFPWALLGTAQHHNRPLMALASYTGVYGLSFVVALGGAALADAIAARRRGRPVPGRAWAALAAVVLAHGAGALDLALEPGDEGLVRLRVAVAQGNIEQGVKWSPAWADRTLALYEDLTRRAAGQGAQVVIWPETAVPGSPDAFPELADRLAGLARDSGVALVVGALGFQDADGRRRFWDSAFAWGPDGAFVARYDKAHLVPFGEYVPLRGLLGRFVEAVARGSADTDVSTGPGPQAFALPLPGNVREMTAGVPICYELLFPDLMRRFAAGGAEALFAITNDAWYGRTGAPYQFLAITELRAAESRLWIARAANTGVSALIDHRGRVREQTGIFERDVRVGEIVLRPPPHGGSFYVRHGDWFAIACWSGAAIAIAASIGTARRSRRTG
jgi:apolipoprotein N-acyltransferase